MERWENLEKAAKQHGIDCEVYVYRNDLNGGSGTFKDISAALAASVLKENGIMDYCLASTGNAGVAFATYLAKAGIKFTEFAPSFIDDGSVKAIQNAGQNIVISKGGYGDAKSEAADYHKNNKVLISGGNTDPLRIESKRTIVFECLRQLGKMPTVYMQAVAGGTSPLAFEKGFNDLQKASCNDLKLPRMLLVQQDECDPMVTAWEKAKANGFPQGWEHDFEAKKVSRHKSASLRRPTRAIILWWHRWSGKAAAISFASRNRSCPISEKKCCRKRRSVRASLNGLLCRIP